MRFFVGLFRHSIWIHDGEFPIDFSPVPQRHRPFFCSLQGGQIQCFKQSCIAGEYGSLAIEFLVCAVQAFDGIGGIDDLADICRKLVDGCQNVPVGLPAFHGIRILVLPLFHDLLHVLQTLFLCGSKVYGPQIGGISDQHTPL